MCLINVEKEQYLPAAGVVIHLYERSAATRIKRRNPDVDAGSSTNTTLDPTNWLWYHVFTIGLFETRTN
jgi:hypothetical protein